MKKYLFIVLLVGVCFGQFEVLSKFDHESFYIFNISANDDTITFEVYGHNECINQECTSLLGWKRKIDNAYPGIAKWLIENNKYKGNTISIQKKLKNYG